jgi:hypothetical protein
VRPRRDPDIIVRCEESDTVAELVRETFKHIKPHESRDVIYDFLLYRLRASVERGEWADLTHWRLETAFAVAQRAARRLAFGEVMS